VVQAQVVLTDFVRNLHVTVPNFFYLLKSFEAVMCISNHNGFVW